MEQGELPLPLPLPLPLHGTEARGGRRTESLGELQLQLQLRGSEDGEELRRRGQREPREQTTATAFFCGLLDDRRPARGALDFAPQKK